MLKKLSSIVITFVFVFVLAACNNTSEEANLASGLDVSSLATKIQEEVTFEDKDLAPLVEQIWHRHIEQVAQEDVAQFHVVAGGGMIAEEIALFEAKDSDAASRVEEGLKARYEYLKNSYGNYSPEQLENLQAPVLVRNGNYVFSVISGDEETTRTVINQWIEENKA